jgi:predicted membrane-bound spermidine synthase
MLAAAWIAFKMFGTAALWTVVMIAAAATALNFLIGDMLLLPRLGNFTSAVIDGVLGGATAWLIIALLPATFYYMTAVYVFAGIAFVAELFFHMYLLSAHVIEKKKTDEDFYRKQKLNYNMESGREIYPYSSRDSNESNGRSGTLNSGYNKSINNQDDYERTMKNDKRD